jgi:Sec-independent protein translocase protein TatA
MVLPLAFFDIQWLLVLAVLGVLLYGERLPQVAAGFGRQLMQLKKAAQAVRNEIESVVLDTKQSVVSGMEKSDEHVREEATAPKFEPPAEPAESVSSGEAR